MSRVETPPGLVVPPGTRVWRAARTVLRSVWVVGLRDPVRAGRLRLDALSPVERQVARGGLVLLVLLLASTLFSAAWRTGQMAGLAGADELSLVPLAVVGPTLLALMVGWVLVTWGALDASPSVRLAVAAVFLVTMGFLEDPLTPPGVESAAMRHGPTLVHVGYLVTAGVVVLSVLIERLGRAGPWLRSAARVVLVASLAAFFLGRLWMDASLGGEGLSAFSVDLTVSTVGALALPIVVSSAVVVVDLALDVSSGVARPAARLRARWAAALLLALVAVKLWLQVGTRPGTWVELVSHQPLTVLRTVVTVALLAVLVAAVTRFPRSETFTDAKEKVIWLGSVVLSLPSVLLTLTTGLGFLVYTQLDSRVVMRANSSLPWGEITRWYALPLAVLVLALGVHLMRRSDGGYGDELGSALVVVGAWNVPAGVIGAFSLPVSLSYPTMDVLVTLGALAVLASYAVRRRAVPASTSALLGAAVVFSWLVLSRADYIATVGGLIGLSAVVVVVVGVLYGLASDSSFASDASKRLPADARPMLFVGYLLLSVVTVHWIEVTHTVPLDSLLADAGFARLAIPLAAWLLGRRLLRREEQPVAP